MDNKLMRGIALSFFLIAILTGSMTMLGAGKNWLRMNSLMLVKGDSFAPVAGFTFAPDGSCANMPVKFTNTSTGDNLTYEWNFEDGTKSTEKDPSHTFATATGQGIKKFEVTLKVTDKDKVSNSVSQNVTVKQTPSLKVGSDQNAKDFEGLPYFVSCTNQDTEFLFLNQSTTKSSNINYTIDWGDGSPKFINTDWSSEKHFYKKGIYQVTYTVETTNGCTITQKFGVFVGSNPAVGLATPGNTNICIGESLTFTITGTENNPVGTIYKVSFSDGSPEQVFSHPPPPTVSHIYEKTSCGELSNATFKNYFAVKILATNPCESSVAQVEPIYVTEPVLPKIKIPNDPVCINKSVVIENVSNLLVDASNSGSCSEGAKFIWEISPATGWTIAPNSLGERPILANPNTWSSGTKIIKPSFQTPGTYTVKLITGNKCGIREEIKTIVVIPTPAPSFTVTSNEVCGPATVNVTNTSNILGNGSDGTYNWEVSYSNGACGTSPKWDFAAGSNKNSENPIFLFNNPGIYTIALSIKASCGTFKEQQKITVIAPPTSTIGSIPLTCGPTTFTPKATVSSCGSAIPTYKWTFEGGTPTSSTSLDPGPIAFNTIGAKKITLEVTSGCGTTKVEKIFSVANPPKIDIGLDQEICKGEEIELKGLVTEGSGNYKFKWTNIPSISISGATMADITVQPTQNTTYTLTVTDQETQCTSSEQVVITVIPAPTIQFSIPDQEICSGESIQVVSLTTSPPGESTTWTAEAGGVTGVTASGTNEIPIQTLTNTTGQQVKVIYTALIANSSQGNCTVIPAKYTVTVNPEPFYTGAKLTICSDKRFDFKPSGVISGSKFTWTVNSPAGITGAINSTQAEASIKQQLQNSTNNSLDVIYTITPSIGICSGEDFTLVVTVQPAPSITFSEIDQNMCTGSDSKEVKFTSDVSGATFTWTADPMGVQGVSTSGTNTIPVQSLINPTAAPITVEYKVNVNTSSGGTCSGVPKTYRITVNPSLDLAEEISDYNGYQISCFGADDGFIKLSPSGGNGIFVYSWIGPNGFTSSNKTIKNLIPGTYQVKVEDEFGCSLSKSFDISEPKKLTASVVSTMKVLCAGDESGAIELAVSGGIESAAYQFKWSRNGVPFPATTKTLTGIPAGTYEVKISDANRCSSLITGIEITEPAAAIVINYTKSDISCYGANDGSLDLDVSGGLPPYTINWSFGSTQSGFDNLGPGDYTLLVSDQSGCIRSQTITIEDAPLFTIDPAASNITCFGNKDGYIKLNLEGGVGATTIRWDHGAELENLFNLKAGFYAVTIKDQTACDIRSEFNIVEPAQLEIEPKVTDALACDNPQSGGIELGVSGGTLPYTILWSNGQTSQNLVGITSGQYAVNITDASGCTVNKVLEVKRPPALAITAFQSTNAQCKPRVIEDEINITISGGIAPYTISWSGGSISADQKTMTTTEPGYYQVTVVDGKGCITTQSFDIENTETIAKAAIESAAFDQYNSYLVNFEIQFWNRSFGKILTYYWNFGDGSESFDEHPKHTYKSEGEYEVVLTVTDVFGCPVEVRKKISVFDYYLVVPNVFTPNGDGINDYFFPKYVGIESLEFWVLNKWGETIFHTVDLSSQGWDGKLNKEPSIPGNYVYKLSFKTLDGRTQTITDLFMLLK